MIRRPAVAGLFYPGDAAALGREVDRLLAGGARAAPASAVRPVALVVPHAGYVYSGAIAAEVYARAELPRRALILGPNHTGRGARVAAAPPDRDWETPLGEVPVDGPLTEALLRSGLAVADAEAHRDEHALELQLPLLQRRVGRFTLAALCLSHLSYSECEALGRAVAAAVRERGPAALVASTDLSHYLPAAAARAADLRALEPLLALDARALHETVHREDISMCGVIPTTVALVAARELGAREATLVRHGHSGETSGDLRRVVGYAGVLLT